VVDLTERGSSELASYFAAFINANAEALDKLPGVAATYRDAARTQILANHPELQAEYIRQEIKRRGG
jgi:hypothetical protein